MQATSQRSLNLRVRPDLQCSRQRFQGGDYWIVKDPVSMRYFRFQEEEYSLLQLFDGQRSAESIQQTFQHQYAPQKISLAEIHQFAGMLYRSALVVSDAPDQGLQLYQRHERNLSKENWGKLANLLSYRFPGFDPSNLLDRLTPWARHLFSPIAVLGFGLLGLFALSLVFTNFESLQQRIPDFQQFFAARNWLWLAVALAITKVLHELGHGVACRRFGGQCHEMGVMLLVLTPCLYCNVSDAWTIPDKWKRIFISAAGMYVELILATLAVIVWWFSEPGVIHYLALNIVFVSGVSTLLFNLNPLLRYDGYYILSDWLEIPNLRQKATQLLQRTASKWILGLPVAHDPFIPNHHVWLFIIYSVAAFAYRWVLTLTIFWFLYNLLEPYGLKIISQLLALFSIYGLLVSPLISISRFFSVPGRSDAVQPSRLAVTGLVTTGILAALLLVPVPHYIDMPFYIQPVGMTSVYVKESGIIDKIQAHSNSPVRQSGPIVKLVNYQMEKQLLEAQAEVAESRRRLQEVRELKAEGEKRSQFAEETAEVQLQNSQSNLDTFQKRIDALQIASPIDGWVLPVADPQTSAGESERLPKLAGNPLSDENLNASLTEQMLVCYVAPNLDDWDVMILVDQQAIEFARPGQAVKLWLKLFPDQVVRTEVTDVAVEPMRTIPAQLASQNGGPIETSTALGGQFKPASAKFLVKARLAANDRQLTKDSTGVARLHVGYETVGRRLWRFLSHTFNFHL